MNNPSAHPPVHATLFVAPGCPHCPQMKQVLADLVAEGDGLQLEIVDISTDLERAEQHGVRSVPWLQLNELELQGVHTRAEIEHWISEAARPTGRQQLFAELLEVGQLAQVEAMLHRAPVAMHDLLVLFADPEQKINVRIGASAVLESLEGTGLLEQVVDQLGKYTQHESASTRVDACHVLSLVNNPAAGQYLQAALQDDDADVREVAGESLQALEEK